MGQITVIQGDITQLEVDVIVNAASRTPQSDDGVDYAIHRAAGTELLAACSNLKSADPGYVKMTPGFRLPAKYVFHALGPVWHDGKHGEVELLAACYNRSLKLASAKHLTSIAFPAISCGSHDFPEERAAKIAIDTCSIFLESDQAIKKVIFCCFSTSVLKAYETALNQLSCIY